MRKDVMGTVIIGIMLIICGVILPFSLMGVHTWVRSEDAMMNDCKLLVDQIIDARECTDTMLENINYSASQNPIKYVVRVTRKVQQINPHPIDAGRTVTTYMVVDNISRFDQGDMVIVEAFPIGESVLQTIARIFLRIPFNQNGIRFAARVR